MSGLDKPLKRSSANHVMWAKKSIDHAPNDLGM